jgi:Glycosyl hydrolase family 53
LPEDGYPSRPSAAIDRRRFIARGLGASAALAIPSWSFVPELARAGESACAAPGFRNSLSISPFAETVLESCALTDGISTAGTLAELQQLYNRHGATETYQRIATLKNDNQGDDELGWARGLDRARLSRVLGMPFNPELGLWAQYGDGSSYQQPPDFSDYPSIRLPGPWTSLTLEEMLPIMRQYGALVARQILGTGVRVNYWDLGNEVESGVAGVTVMPLFPDTSYQAPNNVDPQIGLMSTEVLISMPDAERVAWSQAHLWPYVGKLLLATAQGIRSVDSNAKFSSHISDFGQRSAAIQVGFWESCKSVGYLPDLLGSSYYPTDGKSALGALDKLAFMKQVATELHSQFGRQLFIAEYGYPSATMPPPYPFNDTVNGYPQTPTGQSAFTHDFVAWGVRSGLLAGLRPWAPDYCTASGWEPMSWFALSGKLATAKPALTAVQNVVGLQACILGRLLIEIDGLRRGALRLRLRMSNGEHRHVVIELLRHGRIVGTDRLGRLGTSWHKVSLTPRHGRLTPGRYTLVIHAGGHRLLHRTIHVR